jgi:hypothetical protein
MDFLFNSDEKKEKEKEADTSVKIAKYILPILVYIPITIFVVIIGGFFGIKIYKYIVEGGGISKFIEKNIAKIFGIKDSVNKFIIKTVNTFWPDKDTIIESEKTYKHVRLDSALVLTGSLFILTMIILYNYDYIKSLMFSKVSAGIREAKNKINKERFIIKNNGALLSVGKPGNSMGKIKKRYTVGEYDQLWYLYQPVINPNGVNNDYRKVKKDKDGVNVIQKDIQYYYLYDVEINGQVLKKFNHKQLEGKFLDETINNSVKNINLIGNENYDFIPSGIKVGDEVMISTRKNVYDHNIFNVYDTNTSVDFTNKSLQFVDKHTGDIGENINNWEAHLVIPKKPGVLLKKWGRKGYKKGVYSLATNGNHTGFTLGIKGNGVDTDDPLNNYIFKDINGKTYQTELTDYGVEQFGPNNYIPGFTIVYKIRINKQNKYDVSIFINDEFVMKVKDGGVPLNEIKWCGELSQQQFGNVNINSKKNDKSKVGQYYVRTDIKCDSNNEEMKQIIDGETYCIPKECGSGTDYYDLFSRQCEKCPDGTELEKNTSTNDNFPYPLKDNCIIKESADADNADADAIAQAKAQADAAMDIDDVISAMPGLSEKLTHIKNDFNTVDANAEFSKMLDGMEEIKKELIAKGGYPINNTTKTKTKTKPSFMPTLIVYQTEIIDKQNGKRQTSFVRPKDEEETGIHNKFFNSFAPFTWFKIKRNVSNKIPDVSGRGMAKRNSTLIGGVALLFGFVIFTSLLVNQFNKDIKEAKPEELKDVFINKTSHYTYSIIFIGLALLLFALLLFYAATSDSGSKFLSILLIVLSGVIILAALTVIFRDKIDKFIRNNPYIRFIYHVLFVIPCLFIDLVNYIYYEFKTSPRIVFIVFAIEVAIILSLILIPAIRNRMYLYISNEKGKKEKITMQINNLQNQKIKLEAAIKKIKNFKPFRDPLVRMDLNTVNDVVTKKVKKNKDNGVYEEEITPQNTDVVGIFKKFVIDKKDEISNIAKNINPFADTPVVSTGLNLAAWEIIKKEQLDKKFNAMKLNKLLNSYGYKSVEECDNIMNKKKAYKCKESLAIMLEHIQMNGKNILLFNTVIAEIEDRIVNLNEIKSKSKGPIQKGSVALNKPVYFRTLKYIPIEHFNKSQVEQLKYNYSISCWFFIHSQSPNYNANYHRETSIISYNGEPTIYYHGKNNELIIRSKKLLKDASNDSNSRETLARIKSKELEIEKIIEEIEKEKKESELNKLPHVNIETDSEKILSLEKQKADIESNILLMKSSLEDGKNEMSLIYKKNKFKLQKWHNLVVNYVGGVIDIFLNGKLVSSINRIVSYKLFNRLTIGDKKGSGANGIGGGICNVVYYPTYISKERINTNYNYFKDKNPPTI